MARGKRWPISRRQLLHPCPRQRRSSKLFLSHARRRRLKPPRFALLRACGAHAQRRATMKKATGKTSSNARSTVDDVDAYLAKVPEPARTTLGKLRATIRSVVPSEATEQLSYGMPAFHYNGALVAYGAFKDH